MPTIALEMERLRNPYSGLGQYCLQLGRALAAQPAAGMDFACLVPKRDTGVFGENMQYRTVKPWHKIMPPELGESLWHCSHQDSKYLPRNRKTPLAFTIHDLNFQDRPDYSDTKKSQRLVVMQRKIERAGGLVYISEYVRQWVHDHLQVPTKTIEQVIYNGGALTEIRNQTQVASRKSETGNRKSQFLFSIGIHPKKNYHVLLPILNQFEQYRWVIAGPDSRGYRGELEREAARLGVADRLEFCGPVGDAQKRELYAGCAALLFPSLSEGFGLPVVEAMSLGKPVFLSDRTCLPEIGGVEAYYFTDFEPEAVSQVFAAGMKDFENDAEKPARLSAWAARFTWEKAATQYLEFYQKIITHA